MPRSTLVCASRTSSARRHSSTVSSRAVTSMAKVALVSLEPASPEITGVQVMARVLDAIARCNVEVLSLSSSSYRQNFCFLVRTEELERTVQAVESALALELAHGYVKPILKDLQIYSPEKDGDKPFLDQMRERIIGGVATLLKNPQRDEIATRTDLSGPLAAPRTSTLQTVLGMIRNAYFVEIPPGLEKAREQPAR